MARRFWSCFVKVIKRSRCLTGDIAEEADEGGGGLKATGSVLLLLFGLKNEMVFVAA
jgi:hypothetical protein